MVVDEGTATEFRRRFELPILKGRDAAATDAEHERGKQKLQEVMHVFTDALTQLWACNVFVTIN